MCRSMVFFIVVVWDSYLYLCITALDQIWINFSQSFFNYFFLLHFLSSLLSMIKSVLDHLILWQFDIVNLFIFKNFFFSLCHILDYFYWFVTKYIISYVMSGLLLVSSNEFFFLFLISAFIFFSSWTSIWFVSFIHFSYFSSKSPFLYDCIYLFLWILYILMIVKVLVC